MRGKVMTEGLRLPPEDDEEVTPQRRDRYESQDRYRGRDSYRRRDRGMNREEQVTNIDLEKRKWSNRRRMAWLAFISMILVTAALLFAPIETSRIKILSEPITWFYFAMASVIGAYMGFTTWASKSGKGRR